MSFLKRSALAALGLMLAAPGLALADTYSIMSFTGQLGSSPNIKAPFSGVFTGGEAITGSVLIDNTTRPGAGTGFVNILDDTYPDAALIPANVDFNLQLGGLSFTASDSLDALLLNGPGVQYKDGVFNGLEFVTNFAFSGANYQFRVDGTALTVKLLSGGNVTGSSLMNGKINFGDSPLTPYTVPTGTNPGVPEPATWAMLIVGFGGVGAMMRRRHAKALA